MDNEILKKVVRNYLPVLTDIRKDAMVVLLDEQNPYELFENIAIKDPCLCINLYRSIGEKRQNKETGHITLSALANIYGVNALRNKLTKFSELLKTSLNNKDKDYCTKVIVRSMHLSNQVFALSNLMGDQYPKQMSVAALLFSSGELHYAATKLDEKNYNLTLKEKININHEVANTFNLPFLVKQSTSTSSSGNYQSEIIYWSYRYLLAIEESDCESEIKAQEHIAKLLCIHNDNAHKNLTQMLLTFARENSQYAVFTSARQIMYQTYENKIKQASSAEIENAEENAETYEELPAKSFISWLVDFQKNNFLENKQDTIRLICKEIDKAKPADMFLFIRYCKETRMSRVAWSSCKRQINLQEILQPVDSKDALIDIIVRKDKTINIAPESLEDKNLYAIFEQSFLNKLGVKQLILSPIYEDHFEDSGRHFVYLFCAANIDSALSKDQVNIIRMIRHFFRKQYAIPVQNANLSQNVVQINQN